VVDIPVATHCADGLLGLRVALRQPAPIVDPAELAGVRVPPAVFNTASEVDLAPKWALRQHITMPDPALIVTVAPSATDCVAGATVH
jgi:hypothetical protein